MPYCEKALSQPDRQSHSLHLLKRLLRTYLAPHGRELALAVLLMIVASVTTSGKAVLIRYIFDEIFAKKQADWILPIAAVVFVVFLLGGLAAYGSSIILNRIGQGN